ncbi:hypothetical protein BGX27_009255 [Mortierella sp. AM989]|nr:hypothetical protein BGX27_009255 [Mortierella sp. AM989]
MPSDPISIAKARLLHIANTMGGPSIDPEHSPHRIKPSNTVANRSELNPLHFLARSATIYPSKLAIAYGDRRYTYKELNMRSIAMAYSLKEQLNVQRGDRVAVIAPNIPAMLEVHYAIPAANAIICAINTRLSHSEVTYILEHSGAVAVLCDSEYKDLVKGSKLPTVFIEDSGLPTDPYEQLLAKGLPKATTLGWSGLDQADNEEDGISLCYTSGTTGKPKGVIYTYRGMYLAALGNAIEVLVRQVDYGLIWKTFFSENVTHMNGSPTVMIQIVNHPNAIKLPRPITCSVAASAPTSALIAKMTELNMDICHVYGLTETHGTMMKSYHQSEWDNLPLDERARKLARQGHVYLVSDDVRVVDSKMKDVAWDGKQIGEVVFRGNLMMKGYHKDPEATAKAFAGGWFHSGDLAVRYPDGYISIQDRQKDIIISGGENISTLEVESCISRHPSVLEAAVVGIPSEKWGETPKAFVILKPGLFRDNTVDEPGLIQFCKLNMGGFKCPSSIAIVEELPKTSTGKLMKYVLREQEWKEYSKRIN